MFELLSLSQIVTISAVAFFAAALTAFVGAGGGTILLLVMLYLLPAPSVIPVHGCIQLISNTARVYLFWHHMQWHVIFRFVALMPIGVFLGLKLYESLSPDMIQLLIATAILLSFLIRPKSSQSGRGVPKAIYYLVGLVIGFGNVVVGVLSPILAAILRIEEFEKQQTVGTLGFFGFAGNLFKIAGFTVIGFSFLTYLPVILPACLATIIGSYLGKRLLQNTSNQLFTIAFQAVIILLSLKLIFDVMM